MKGIKQIKEFLGLKEVSDFTYIGKDGNILRVDEASGKFKFEETPGSVLTIPIYQIRVSVDHGADGTGEMGNYDKPFKTINAASTFARNEIIATPTLKDKILINVEQGEYIDETDILFDGWVHCEPDVVIKTPTVLSDALFLVHSNGEKFKLTGYPDIIDVGSNIWDSTASFFTLLSFYLEASTLVKIQTGILYCEEINFNIKKFDLQGFFQKLYFVNLNLKINTYIPPNYSAVLKFIDSINSTLPHNININIDYLDNVTRISSWGVFIINPIFWDGVGFSDNFDSDTRIHIDGGDYNYTTPLQTSLINMGTNISTVISKNKIYISSNGINTLSLFVPSFLGDVASKDIMVSGTFNCYDIAIYNPQTTQLEFTANELVINSINNNIIMSSSVATNLIDIDVIGSLTMVTTTLPKYDSSVATLTYISDLPGGSVSSIKIITQVAHGFSVEDILGMRDGYILADESLAIPAIGMVITVIDVDSFEIQFSGIIETTGTYIDSVNYYLDSNGGVTTTYPLNSIQSIFNALEPNKIYLDIDNMFTL